MINKIIVEKNKNKIKNNLNIKIYINVRFISFGMCIYFLMYFYHILSILQLYFLITVIVKKNSISLLINIFSSISPIHFT